MNRQAGWAVALGACVTTGVVNADDVSGQDAFVCTAWHAVTCTTEGNCDPSEAWRLNMPDFIKVDLRAMELVTPARSDQPRFAEIQDVARNEGRVFLSGWQGLRSFTWIINEATGEGTLAIVSDTTVITVFTACAGTDVLG